MEPEPRWYELLGYVVIVAALVFVLTEIFRVL